ncbi:MAG: hypothetical protein R2827_09365 [Bdellovibrionales bacterium]
MVLLILVAFFATTISFQSNDFYTYLSAGIGYWKNGQPLLFDFQSIHFQGQLIGASIWLFVWLLGGLYQLLGDFGSIGLRFLLITTPVVYFYWYGLKRLNHSHFLSFMWSFFLLLGVCTRVQLRPEIVSYFFLLHFAFVISEVEKTDQTKKLVYLIPFYLVWVQIHATSKFGLICSLHFYALVLFKKFKNYDLKNAGPLGLCFCYPLYNNYSVVIFR